MKSPFQPKYSFPIGTLRWGSLSWCRSGAKVHHSYIRLRMHLAMLALAIGIIFQAVAEEEPYAWAPGEQEACNRFAELKDSGKFAEAIPVAESWVRICEASHGPDSKFTRKSFESLAMVYLIAHRYPEAESLYARALKIAEREAGPYHFDTGVILKRMAFLCEASNRKSESAPLLARVQNLESWNLRGIDVGESLINQGMRYRSMGRYVEAEAQYLGALKMIEDQLGRDHPKAGYCLSELASLYAWLRRFDEAEIAVTRSLGIVENQRGRCHGLTINTLTILQNIPSKFDNARERKDQATKEILQITDDNLIILMALFGAGHLRFIEEAESYATRRYYLSSYYLSSGSELYLAKAEQHLLRALDATESKVGTNDLNADRIIKTLAELYRRSGRFAEAEPLYLRGLQQLETTTGTKSDRVRGHLGQMFKFYFDGKEMAKARSICERLIECDRELIEAQLLKKSEGELLGSSLGISPGNALSLGDGSLAADAILLYKGIALDGIIERHRSTTHPQTNEAVPPKSKIDQLKQDLAKNQLVGYLTGLDAEKTSLIEKNLQEIEKVSEPHSTGKEQLHQLLSIRHQDIADTLPENMALVEYFSYSHYIGNQRWQYRYSVVIIRKGHAPVFEICGFRESIDKVVTEYRDAIQRVAAGDGDDAVVLAKSQELYGHLLSKVAPHLEGVDVLIISPDKSVNFVPFAALIDPEGKFFAEKMLIYHVASGRDIIPKTREATAKGTSTVFGDPLFASTNLDGAAERPPPDSANTRVASLTSPLSSAVKAPILAIELPQLPGSRVEAMSVGNALQNSSHFKGSVTTRFGPDATEAAIRNLKSPEILHLATHGFFLSDLKSSANRSVAPSAPGDQSPTQASGSGANQMFGCAIALSGAGDTLEKWSQGEIPDLENDGILLTGEIAGLNLQGTELVTLSACKTALSESSGNGINGMRRAFVTAGARNVLMTLWDIADEPTASFMKNFYQQYGATGNAPRALAELQRNGLVKLRDTEGVAIAVYLAGPFVMSAQARK